ncbi:MAG: bifunctional folylpolyglutamate synthase/dihydrofolate synthase [Chloroflexi bacterium]|nr:bifunctional folylpolyglutamate synthase/dihydrofolate synthase [Chloroflexota bacterium]
MSVAIRDTNNRLDYPAAVRRAMGLADFERGTHSPGHSTFHLERISRLLERLGNPHLAVPTVHVAGTKGKGSTAAMITSILSAAGKRVGLYTSPSLHTVTERVRVGTEPIAQEDFASLVERMWPEVEWVGEHGGHGPLMYFEFLTALAFQHFSETNADFQVIEVGLGGRLDATNVVHPAVSVITSISLDHTSVLGDTIPLIAAEKAGIIKDVVPVVVAPQDSEALETIQVIADERGSPIVDVGQTLKWRSHSADLAGQAFTVRGLKNTYNVSLPLIGDYQQENAATAIAAAETLVDAGHTLTKANILAGLRKVRWPGRFQVLRREEPPVIADGAHNPYSMRRFVDALPRHVDFEHLFVVFGAVSGHSAVGMLEELAALDPTVIAVQSRHPKAASVEEIAEAAQTAGVQAVMEYGGVGVATQHALELATSSDTVVGTGSLSVVGEMIEELEGVKPELYPYLRGVKKRNGRQG